MSELNERISEWCIALGQRLGRKSTDELEDHLRSIIDSLATTGLSESERFLVAAHRLGHPDALSAEYVKNDPFAIWRGRLAWMLVGLVPLDLLLTALASIGGAVSVMSLNWGWPPWAAAAAYFAARALILLGLLALCLWAGRATRPVRWAPAGWLPTSFTRLVGVLIITVIALHLAPIVMSRFSTLRAGPVWNQQYFELVGPFSIGNHILFPVFYAAAAFLIAWLITAQRDEPDAVSE